LPLATAPAPRVEPPHRTASPGLAILLVEDDRDAAETLEQLLQMEGHRTRLAFDGRSGLEAFRELAPDVVISDIGLPDMSGYELITQIRRLEEGQRVFAVALTGYAQDEDVEQARRAGFDAHLPKAAPLERLHELLAQAAASERDRAPPSSTPRPGADGGDAHVS
jgi:CheY-like chemotaxis protein